ncbi:CYTH and CHAD domain-containing protein [Celerinatantimonas yamalensis]|uniref:CYTH domain-containing protein n=1 Tax=Celerinatantimonas yamalensis TaxID=559956 RepID=A0ABW9GAA2_9GAMM
MNSEIELKFYTPDDCLAKLHRILDEFSILQHEVRHLRSVYFDTNDRQLRRWRMGLRIRSGDEKNVQTLKTAGRTVGGLNERPEYNQVIDGQRPQLSRFEQLDWPADVSLDTLEQALLPIFVTDFERTTWLVDLDNETLIEVALDRGELEADERREPIHELELELIKGDVGQLFYLAQQLAQLDGLLLASTSKAKRGYALADGLPNEQPARLGFVPLTPQNSLLDAFNHSIEYALAHWQRHQQIFIESSQLRALFEIKQAARLMHQILNLYQEVLNFDCPWHSELLWLVRQFDWLDEATHIRSLLDEQGKFIRKLSNRRVVRKKLDQRLALLPDAEQMMQFIGSARYNALILNMALWIYQGGTIQPKQPQELVDFASRTLEQSWQDLRQSEFALASIDLAQYTRMAGRLRRNLMVGNCLGALFDPKARDEFRLLWLDLLGGIEDLRLLEPIAELARNLSEHEEDVKKVRKWLKRKQASITDAMEFTRTEALARDDYWHF